MTQATPLPDHGSEWGLGFLLLLLDLYGLVVLLGVGTVVAIALTRFDRRIPTVLEYLLGGLLVASLGFSGIVGPVVATVGRFDLVAVIALGVHLPPLLVALRRRAADGGRPRVLATAAMAWSFPFLLGFGMIGGIVCVARGVRTAAQTPSPDGPHRDRPRDGRVRGFPDGDRRRGRGRRRSVGVPSAPATCAGRFHAGGWSGPFHGTRCDSHTPAARDGSPLPLLATGVVML